MEIRLAKTAGFCFGVKRAVDMAYQHQNTLNTYTFGPIIHNDTVINELRDKGISPIYDMDHEEIKTLIIRSHGVSPEVYETAKNKDIVLIDATCPYVKKIHKLVASYFKKGYKIIIIGNKTHPEVEGINGWAQQECIIVKDLEELKRLGLNKEEAQYLIVAQTTYKKEAADQIVQFFGEEGYDYKYVNTICNATKERQEEATQLSQQSDCMLVIGSPYSSNTLKLYEICKKYCEKSYCIAEAHELTEKMIENCNWIGMTAGASTPASVINEVMAKLHKMNT